MSQKSQSQSGSNTVDGNDSSNKTSTDEAALALKNAVTSGAQNLSSEVKHLASDVGEQAKKAAESQVTRGQNFAAEQLGGVASALRKTEESLREDDGNMITSYVGGAAKQVERVSDYLQTRTLAQLIGDVEGFAKREPAIFLGGAFLLGIAGGRFMKSSRPSTPAGSSARMSGGQSMGGGGKAKSDSSSQSSNQSGNKPNQSQQSSGQSTNQGGNKANDTQTSASSQSKDGQTGNASKDGGGQKKENGTVDNNSQKGAGAA